MYGLVIGNRNYSTWSLRAWLALRESGIAFEETRIPLFVDGWRERIRAYSSAERVPVLVDGELRVWDSLAIIEHLIEREPRAVGWPENPEARATCRSVCAEMHSGFLAVREHLPMNIRSRQPLDEDEQGTELRRQIDRIRAIWTDARERWNGDGDWLFGAYSVADVMYAPVVFRFRTYGIAIDEPGAVWSAAMLARPAMRQWERAAEAETEALDFIDSRGGTDGTPLVLG